MTFVAASKTSKNLGQYWDNRMILVYLSLFLNSAGHLQSYDCTCSTTQSCLCFLSKIFSTLIKHTSLLPMYNISDMELASENKTMTVNATALKYLLHTSKL
jgi:hypothetical protein